MPRVPPHHNTRFALCYRVNLLLAERGALVRVVSARNPAERKVLGDYFLVDNRSRHIILRDHVDLDGLADEVAALRPGEEAQE
jgi:hypothetical protein